MVFKYIRPSPLKRNPKRFSKTCTHQNETHTLNTKGDREHKSVFFSSPCVYRMFFIRFSLVLLSYVYFCYFFIQNDEETVFVLIVIASSFVWMKSRHRSVLAPVRTPYYSKIVHRFCRWNFVSNRICVTFLIWDIKQVFKFAISSTNSCIQVCYVSCDLLFSCNKNHAKKILKFAQSTE